LKYLSINPFICSPNFQIRKATRKNLPALLTIDAITKSSKFISKAPPETVNTLYGIGVNPAIGP
jgi:hypothetical protein